MNIYVPIGYEHKWILWNKDGKMGRPAWIYYLPMFDTGSKKKINKNKIKKKCYFINVEAEKQKLKMQHTDFKWSLMILKYYRVLLQYSVNQFLVISDIQPGIRK